MVDPIILLESAITKICHDLASPIGAIQNGVEFFNENISEEMNEKSMDIISLNSHELCVKLKFLRAIYGRSQSDGEVEISEVQAIAKEFLELKKITIELENEKKAENYVQLTYKASKLLLLLIFIATESLIQGGDIKLILKRYDATKVIEIIGTGKKVKELDEFNSIISGDLTIPIKSHTAHYYFTEQLAKLAGASISYNIKDGRLNIFCKFE